METALFGAPTDLRWLEPNFSLYRGSQRRREEDLVITNGVANNLALFSQRLSKKGAPQTKGQEIGSCRAGLGLPEIGRDR